MTLTHHSGRLAKPVEEPPYQWGWLETFVAVQYLSSGLIMLPGTQPFRFLIRAMPYAASLALLILGLVQTAPRRRKQRERAETPTEPLTETTPPPAKKWVGAILLWLLASQLHPDTYFASGLAQLIFQLSIYAPIFWVWKRVHDTKHLERLIWLMLLCNGASAVTGLLQVYFPDRFMPAEFTSLGLSQNAGLLDAMTYTGADGRKIIRPPGLSDLPGGASGAGMAIGFLGVVLASQPGSKLWRRLFCLALSGIGVFILYLTQVRSLLLMMIIVIGVMCLLLWRQKRFTQVITVSSMGGGLVVAAFIWAVSVGGSVVTERFLSVAQEGAVSSFKQNRGHFVAATFGEWMFDYPLGAGVGRWGMMNIYFGNKSPDGPRPLWAEIQITGWLFDGGIVLWLLTGGAIVVSLRQCYQLVTLPGAPPISYFAAIIFCLSTFVLGQCFAGPCFNTQLGIQFWFGLAALHGAGARELRALDEAAEQRRIRRRELRRAPLKIADPGTDLNPRQP